MKEIFVIFKITCDPMENHDPIKDVPVGFVHSEDEAKKICEDGGTVKKTDCWAFWGNEPNFTYKKVTELNK